MLIESMRCCQNWFLEIFVPLIVCTFNVVAKTVRILLEEASPIWFYVYEENKIPEVRIDTGIDISRFLHLHLWKRIYDLPTKWYRVNFFHYCPGKITTRKYERIIWERHKGFPFLEYIFVHLWLMQTIMEYLNIVM